MTTQSLRDAAQATLAKIDELDRQLQWEHSLSIKDEREFKDLRTALAADKAQDAQPCECQEAKRYRRLRDHATADEIFGLCNLESERWDVYIDADMKEQP